MRTPTRQQKPRRAALKRFPAPIAGLIANRSLAVPNGQGLAPGASVLRNYLPTSSGILLRRGSLTRASTAAAGDVKAMWRYAVAGNERLFAATDAGIWDVTSTPAASGRTVTSGEWSVVQFATAGGVFLVGVNGLDAGWTFNGTTFADLSVTGSGITNASFSHVWVYKQRIYLIESNSLNVWYLPVDQIGGAATKLPLGGVFPLGGKLLFGQSWSSDSSASGGLSEQCIFVTSEGEVAVYQGLSPADTASWGKVGTYRIGRPLGQKAFVRAGGDLLIATTVGLISLAEASRRDLAALGAAAVSYPVEDAWRASLATYGNAGWSCETWPEGGMILVAPPPGVKAPIVYVVNSNTGAWAELTGWKVTAFATFQGRLFFGTSGGVVKEGWTGGSDDGLSYVGQYAPLFDDFGAPGSRKIAHMIRVVWRAIFESSPSVAARFDYNTSFPPPPSGDARPAGDTWGTGLWGQAKWSSASVRKTFSKWFSAGGSGDKVGVAVQFTSGDSSPIDVEIVEVELTYTVADIVT